MDARSIAATAANGGYLTAASELTDVEYTVPDYHFEQGVYDKRVYNGWGHPEPDYALKFGPNIKDWPEQPALTDDLLVKIVSYITDPVTTTDELIPSGETSSFRSNPPAAGGVHPLPQGPGLRAERQGREGAGRTAQGR